MFQMAYVSACHRVNAREACFETGTKAHRNGLQWQANKPNNNILVSAFFSAFPFHDF